MMDFLLTNNSIYFFCENHALVTCSSCIFYYLISCLYKRQLVTDILQHDLHIRLRTATATLGSLAASVRQAFGNTRKFIADFTKSAYHTLQGCRGCTRVIQLQFVSQVGGRKILYALSGQRKDKLSSQFVSLWKWDRNRRTLYAL